MASDGPQQSALKSSGGLKLVLKLSKPRDADEADADADEAQPQALPALKLKLKLPPDGRPPTPSPAPAAPVGTPDGGPPSQNQNQNQPRKLIIKVAGHATASGVLAPGSLDDEVELSRPSPRPAAPPPPAATSKPKQKRTMIPVSQLGDAPAKVLKQLQQQQRAAGSAGHTSRKRRRAHSSEDDDDDAAPDALLEADDEPVRRRKPAAKPAAAPGGAGGVDVAATGSSAGGGDAADSSDSDDESSKASGAVAVGAAAGAGEPAVRPVLPKRSRKMFMPLKKALTNVVHFAQKRDRHFMFYEPVDPTVVPDYHEVIKRPMCIATMRKKLAADEYATMAELQADLDLMYDNAMLYNPPDNLFHKEAQKQKEELRAKLNGYLERFPALRTESLTDPHYARHRKELEQKREAKRLQREEAEREEEARRTAARQRKKQQQQQPPPPPPQTAQQQQAQPTSAPAATATTAGSTASGSGLLQSPLAVSSASSRARPTSLLRRGASAAAAARPGSPGFSYAAYQQTPTAKPGAALASNFLTSPGAPAARPALASPPTAPPPVDAQSDLLYSRSLENFVRTLDVAPVRSYVAQILGRLRVPPRPAGRRDVSVAGLLKEQSVGAGLNEELLRMLAAPAPSSEPPSVRAACEALQALVTDAQVGAALQSLVTPILASWINPASAAAPAGDAVADALERNFAGLYALQLLQLERTPGAAASDAEFRLVQQLNDSLAELAARCPPDSLLPVQLRAPPPASSEAQSKMVTMHP